eukprot:CAMPEP_0117521834 /NCGR_PEP_ID=MMETSP0784-20121206/33892_1 /TAXON_ID=39447 /ORGANISM="" /LENGTH=71 /DNA_ID=CAMNT_0005317879 /DNA_START=234 /DNA_END=449 /DNA_ORIENTATION=-
MAQQDVPKCVGDDYSMCDLTQDLRSIMSFASGMLVSAMAAGGNAINRSELRDGVAQDSVHLKRVKLYLYML